MTGVRALLARRPAEVEAVPRLPVPAPTSFPSLALGDETVLLLPEKAAFLPKTGTLLVADAHFGKATSFRQLGVPVPSGTTMETLLALSAMIRRLDARRIVFLGDFLHSARAHAPDTIAALHAWRAEHPALELVLVRGNHDDHAGDPPASLAIEVVDEPLREGGLALCHHPRPVAGAFTVCGHLHPCVSVGGRAHDWHRLACFWVTPRLAVLPAFGAFTGMQAIRVGRGERVFAVLPDRVAELAPRLR